MKKIAFLITVLSIGTGAILSYETINFKPHQVDLEDRDSSVYSSDTTKKGCCKIQYPSGGYDFFLATEKECKSHKNFHKYLGSNNTLCMRWGSED